MSNSARKFARQKAKRKFKTFLKENPKYKAMTFQKFNELYKAGLIQFKEESDLVYPEQHKTVEDYQDTLEDVLLDEEIEEDEDSDIE